MTASQIVSYVLNVLLGAYAGWCFAMWRIYYKRYVDTLNELGPLTIGKDWLAEQSRKDASTIRVYEAEIATLKAHMDDLKSDKAIPVVRCKDCEFHQSDDYSNFYDGYWCGYSESFTKPEDYCSHAEKKEETKND